MFAIFSHFWDGCSYMFMGFHKQRNNERGAKTIHRCFPSKQLGGEVFSGNQVRAVGVIPHMTSILIGPGGSSFKTAISFERGSQECSEKGQQVTEPLLGPKHGRGFLPVSTQNLG